MKYQTSTIHTNTEKLIPYIQRFLSLNIKILSSGMKKADLDFQKHIFTWYTAKCTVKESKTFIQEEMGGGEEEKAGGIKMQSIDHN